MSKSKKNSSYKNEKKSRRNKSKSTNRQCNGNNQSNSSSNTKTSKLCAFSYVDYIVLASTLAIALGEELSSDDINILASFFAVLSDELALISSVQSCGEAEESPVFIPPTPDVAVTSRNNTKYKKKK